MKATLKIRFQTKEGKLICRTQHLDYFTRERAVKVAIRKGAQTLQSTDELGRVQDLTHFLQNRTINIKQSLKHAATK